MPPKRERGGRGRGARGRGDGRPSALGRPGQDNISRRDEDYPQSGRPSGQELPRQVRQVETHRVRGRGDGQERASAPGRPGRDDTSKRDEDYPQLGLSSGQEPPRQIRQQVETHRTPDQGGRPLQPQPPQNAPRRTQPEIHEIPPQKEGGVRQKVQPSAKAQTSPSKESAEVLESIAGLSFEHKQPEPRKKYEIAKRQPPGTLGRPINLIANYFVLKYKDFSIFHYDVEIIFKTQYRTDVSDKKGASGEEDPIGVKIGDSIMKVGLTAKEDAEKGISHVEHQQKRAPGKQRCRHIITEMINTQMIKNEKFRAYNPVYDGQKNLYTTKELPIQDTQKQVSKFIIKLNEEGRIREFEVIIQPVRKVGGGNLVNLEPLRELYQGRSTEIPQEVIMAFDTIMCHRNPPFTQTQVGRSFFLLDDKKYQLGEGLEIWFGYNQSVHLTQRGPAIIVNYAAKAFHKEGDVIAYAEEILGCDITKQPRLPPHQIKILEEALTKVKVEVTHLRYPRKYHVKKLTRTSAKETRFKEADNTETSVADYFKKKHKPLRFPHLPCLHMRTNKDTFIPMEVCRICPGQPKLGKLSGQMTSKMIRQTAITPDERFDKIWGNAHLIQEVSGPLMKQFGLLMELQFMQLQGRVLGAPQLRYKARGNDAVAKVDFKGTWKMDGMQFFKPSTDTITWMLISFSGERFCTYNHLERFADTLCSTARDVGINLESPLDIRIFRSHETTRAALEFVKQQNVTFAVVVLSSRDHNHSYEEVKFIADIQLHLVTQCMDDGVVVRKFNNQVATNVLLKINSKVGGVNHALHQKPAIFSRPIIVFGADAAHSPRGYDCPSIAAVVGSLDANPCRYAVTCRVQQNPDEKKLSQEIITELKDMVREILRSFLKHTHGKKPERIIFFRDGVSEGQFNTVLEREINLIQYACQEELDGFLPPLTFIVVQKRHQTRFRPQNRKDGVGRPGNVPPGTTVDTDVVHPVFFDFFLCSHEGIQGTSKPAHYTILYDENKFSSDELQQLCYHLCHTYVRCNRSISVPAPVMYADLACTRAKKYADLYLRSDTSSVISGSSEGTRRLPDHIVDAISNMGNFQPGMFYV